MFVRTCKGLSLVRKSPRRVLQSDCNHCVVLAVLVTIDSGFGLIVMAVATVVRGLIVGLLARRLVSHTWSNAFANTVAAIVADALGVPFYGDILPRLRPDRIEGLKRELRAKGALDQAYWFCPLSVNQHANICGSFAPGDYSRKGLGASQPSRNFGTVFKKGTTPCLGSWP